MSYSGRPQISAFYLPNSRRVAVGVLKTRQFRNFEIAAVISASQLSRDEIGASYFLKTRRFVFTPANPEILKFRNSENNFTPPTPAGYFCVALT